MNQKKTTKASDEAYSNYQEVGGDANDKSQSNKQLPLWLREGLEKIKQEKQKKETEKKETKKKEPKMVIVFVIVFNQIKSILSFRGDN